MVADFSCKLTTKIIPRPCGQAWNGNSRQTRQPQFHVQPVLALNCSTVQSASMIKRRSPLAEMPFQPSEHAIYDGLNKQDTILAPAHDTCN